MIVGHVLNLLMALDVSPRPHKHAELLFNGEPGCLYTYLVEYIEKWEE